MLGKETRKIQVYNGNSSAKVAIALTESEVLCGFVEYQELVQILASTPELRSVIGEATAAELGASKAAVNAAFCALISADKSTAAPAIQALTKRLLSADSPLTTKERLVLRLNEQGLANAGILSAFILNHVTLKPSQAICVAANVPYAYVSGDLLECSDSSSTANGFAPKLGDAAVIREWLTHSQGSPKIFKGTEPSSSRPWTVTYNPPIGNFEIFNINFPHSIKFIGQRESIRPSKVPQTLHVQGGQGRIFKRDPVRANMHTNGDWQELELHKGAHASKHFSPPACFATGVTPLV
ncbi:RmlC-like cupin [Coccomyxa subellipsoidea C-169]|uniref:RmlC-like cupin n=1 Tax=Coccomyxa subellipsoidea (strain C-169) TaxID=574566 RepID=I0YNG5_COCSC|nr:RmlC-like cupin [Coccomyxa subellipsoidea C-169]EIE19934.1 RmlC-like cupin [Coccomyxa subellipsoidea C-169]|eukprot:XP_005644478.1 RmlC-like cupin [Coccomyxa subellipsoidea C-169]